MRKKKEVPESKTAKVKEVVKKVVKKEKVEYGPYGNPGEALPDPDQDRGRSR